MHRQMVCHSTSLAAPLATVLPRSACAIIDASIRLLGSNLPNRNRMFDMAFDWAK